MMLRSKYDPHFGSWHSKPRNSTNVSSFWKGVLLSKSLLWPNISFRVRNGRMTSFWCNKWYSEILLKCLYPILYQESKDKDTVVGEVWHRNRQNFVFKGRLTSCAKEELRSLKTDIVLHKLDDIMLDLPIWRCKQTCCFLVKFAYEQFIDAVCRLPGLVECKLSSEMWGVSVAGY